MGILQTDLWGIEQEGENAFSIYIGKLNINSTTFSSPNRTKLLSIFKDDVILALRIVSKANIMIDDKHKIKIVCKIREI